MKIIKKVLKNNKEMLYFCGIRIRKKKLVCLDYHIDPKIEYTPDGTPKSILIFAADSIGDYILMRNFYSAIKTSKKYKNAKLTLIASATVKSIPEYLDADVIDHVLYIPHRLFEKPFYEQYKEVNKLFSNGLKNTYDLILFPSHNVNVFRYIQDILISKIQAKEIIGTTGDLEFSDNQHFLQYTQVLPVEFVDFEYKLNRNFFEKLLDQKIDTDIPTIKLAKTKSSEKYAVICVGAQDNFRKWHLKNYAQIVSYLQNNRKLKVYLIGTKSEAGDMQIVNQLSGEKAEILAGLDYKTLFNLINNASLYIGNDSGFFHVAVALRTKAICISSGGSYPRFIKYPESEKYKIIVNDVFMKLVHQNYKTKHQSSFYSINAVTVDDVENAIEQLSER
ncbi:MAG: glycosyltransferase family 9 protein [Alphaproteobacteria bacterium]|nr:glycosyltransferase family 9 protein [Alphaproteobacteria bacterium]